MSVALFDLTGVATGTTVTGSITLGSALPGHSLFADAGVSDGDEVRYLLKDGSNRELGTGTYTASGTVLSRDTVHASIISGVRGTTKLTLSGAAEVYLVASSGDFGGGGGGGLIPISTTAASSDAAVDIALTGGYSKYRLVIEHLIPATNGTALYFRFSDDDASTFDSGASDYGWLYGLTGLTTNATDNADSKITTTPTGIGNTSGRSFFGRADILLADGTSHTLLNGRTTYLNSGLGYLNGTEWIGSFHNATRPTHIRAFMASGNITSGTFHLYGIADGA